jgi:hypothetical protein
VIGGGTTGSPEWAVDGWTACRLCKSCRLLPKLHGPKLNASYKRWLLLSHQISYHNKNGCNITLVSLLARTRHCNLSLMLYRGLMRASSWRSFFGLERWERRRHLPSPFNCSHSFYRSLLHLVVHFFNQIA